MTRWFPFLVIVLVLAGDEVAADRPRIELERTGADRIFEPVVRAEVLALELRFGHDEDVSEVVEERGIRSGEGDFDRLGIDHLDARNGIGAASDILFGAGHARKLRRVRRCGFRIQDAVDGERGIVRRQIGAIREGGVVVNLERVAELVELPAFHNAGARSRLIAHAIGAHELLEEEFAAPVRLGVVRQKSVDRCGFTKGANDDDVVTFLEPGSQLGAGIHRCRQGELIGPEDSGCRHCGGRAADQCASVRRETVRIRHRVHAPFQSLSDRSGTPRLHARTVHSIDRTPC